MESGFSNLPQTVKIWVIVGFAFSLFYFILSSEVSSGILTFSVVTCGLLFGVGSLLIIINNFSAGRICWLIGGILGLPLGLVMVVGANVCNKIMKAAAPTNEGQN